MSIATSKARVISVRQHNRNYLLSNPNFTYVGRACWGWGGSIFANPFKVSTWGHGASVRNFETNLLEAYNDQPVTEFEIPGSTSHTSFQTLFENMVFHLPKLRGKALGCWCGIWSPDDQPINCHACVLAMLVNAMEAEDEYGCS